MALTGMFLVIAAALAVIPLYMSLFSSNNFDNLDGCRLFIAAEKLEQDKLQNSLIETNVVDTNCYTGNRSVSGRSFTTKDAVQSFFAQEMARTWWAVHEGTVSALWSDRGWSNFWQYSGDRKCVILRTIDITEDVASGRVSTVSEFDEYLQSTVHKENLYGRDWSYSDYIQFYGNYIKTGSPQGAYTIHIGSDTKPLILGSENLYAIAISSYDFPVLESQWFSSIIADIQGRDQSQKEASILMLGYREDLVAEGCKERYMAS